MGKILILADIHGRQFWKDACLNHKDEFEKIVFLGDYVSPYPYEEISNKKAIEVFEEVLNFKKENTDKVVLLMGNHDFSYINSSICECRTDFTSWNKLNGLFTDKKQRLVISGFSSHIPVSGRVGSTSGLRTNCSSGMVTNFRQQIISTTFFTPLMMTGEILIRSQHTTLNMQSGCTLCSVDGMAGIMAQLCGLTSVNMRGEWTKEI